jgi:hypothetical protein
MTAVNWKTPPALTDTPPQNPRGTASPPEKKMTLATHASTPPKKITHLKFLLNYWRTLISKASHVSQGIFICQPQIQSGSRSALTLTMYLEQINFSSPSYSSPCSPEKFKNKQTKLKRNPAAIIAAH